MSRQEIARTVAGVDPPGLDGTSERGRLNAVTKEQSVNPEASSLVPSSSAG